MLIGLIGDTHLPGSVRDPWPEVAEAFRGVDLILHAGDIVSHRVLDWLENIAPVLAALGNNDFNMDDPRVKPTQTLELEGWRLGLLHDVTSGVPAREAAGHPGQRPHPLRAPGLRQRSRRGEPGEPNTAAPQSTRLGTVGILDVTSERLKAAIVKLGDGPMVRGALLINPGRELHLEMPGRESGKSS